MVFPFSSVNCDGSDEQVSVFKHSLQGKESKHLTLRWKFREKDDCPELKVWTTSTGEERIFSWAQDDPKVYLLNFWTTWFSKCQHSMAHNQEMLAKNPDWQGHAEIIAISLDNDAEDAQERINEKGWTLVSSYWGGQDLNASIPRNFKINGIPMCLLVKKGKILWRGDPSTRDLEADYAFDHQ